MATKILNLKAFVWSSRIILFLLVIYLYKKCQPEPEIVTKTTVEYVRVTDTVTNTVIEKDTIQIYVEKFKTVKGKDSLIYRDRPNENTVSANWYNTKLETENASADLRILSIGEVIDVEGTINFKQENTTTEITKVIPMSGLFLYGEASVVPMFQRAELGLDYQIKNTICIGASGSYDNISKTGYVNLKVGFNILNGKN